MPPWCIGIHGSNPYKLNTLAKLFYSVIPLTRIPSALLVAKLKMEQETVLEPDGAFNFSGVGCGRIPDRLYSRFVDSIPGEIDHPPPSAL